MYGILAFEALEPLTFKHFYFIVLFYPQNFYI